MTLKNSPRPPCLPKNCQKKKEINIIFCHQPLDPPSLFWNRRLRTLFSGIDLDVNGHAGENPSEMTTTSGEDSNGTASSTNGAAAHLSGLIDEVLVVETEAEASQRRLTRGKAADMGVDPKLAPCFAVSFDLWPGFTLLAPSGAR